MFVQIMEGQAGDRDGIRRLSDRWTDEIRPGATGYAGSVGGVSADGRFVIAACFESEAAARTNSDRPEQSAWWAEFEQCVEGTVTFDESSDVTVLLGGAVAGAGFVQAMRVTGVDRALVDRLDELFVGFSQHRPDLLGVIRAWTSPSDYVEMASFSSEEEARRGESAELPDELQAAMGGFEDLLEKTEFVDITDVWSD